MCFLPQFTEATGIITLESVIFPMRFCVHSFIPDIYIAPLQETYSEALSVQLWPKRNVFKKVVERRHIVLGQQAQRKRELIPSGGANHRESSMETTHRYPDPRNLLCLPPIVYQGVTQD